MAVLGQLENYHPPRPSAKNSAIPTLLSNLIMELLAKEAKNRPSSAEDVIDRLRRIPLHDLPTSPASTDDWRNPARSKSVDRWEVEEDSNLPILLLLFYFDWRRHLVFRIAVNGAACASDSEVAWTVMPPTI